jgi:cysteinyl-tRNA synthetase
MANYWMHNGFLQVEGEKMAKSTGNFITINELLRTNSFGGRCWSGEALRLAMLRTHYRQPIDWTVTALEEAETALLRFSAVAEWAEQMNSSRESFADPPLPNSGPSSGLLAALSDDINTPAAIAHLHFLYREIQTATTNGAKTDAMFRLWQDAEFLGFDLGIFRKRFEQRKFSDAITYARVSTLIEERNVARKAKNFKESDRIRDELAAMGVVLKDSKDGTTWEVAR